MTAEGMRDRRNDSDLAYSVLKTIPARSFAAGVRDFSQRDVLRHAAQNFVESNHYVRRPDSIFFQRHEFDKANDYAFFPRKSAESCDLIFVEAAHQHTVHF